MNNTPYIPTTLKSRGYFCESRADGRWLVKGRGMRRVVSGEELQYILNPPPKRKAAQQ